MKKILLSILSTLMLTPTISATEKLFTITKVGTINATWSESNKDVFETCVNGYSYYVLEAGYRSGLATVWEEIDHPILGKISVPKKCND